MKEALLNWIKSSLGAPIINLEITDEQIYLCIDEAIELFAEYAYGDNYEVKVFEFNEVLDLPFIKNILLVVRKNSAPITYHWNQFTRQLQIFEKYYNDDIIIKFKRDYVKLPPEELYNNRWVREYSKNKSKLLWGEIIGKFSGNVIGGGTLNYDRIISEANTELERLRTELIEMYSDPMPFCVG